MRFTTRPVLGVLLAVAVGNIGFAEESKSHWWSFGGDKEVASSPASVTPAPTMKPASPAVTPVEDESWFSWPSMRKLSWFESSTTTTTDPFTTGAPVATDATTKRRARTNYGKPAHLQRPRNTWAQQPASEKQQATSTSPWHAMTESTKSAWHKTVEYVSPGESSDKEVVATDSHESWWHKMWGGEEEHQGPQTVTEWMAQDRIDP